VSPAADDRWRHSTLVVVWAVMPDLGEGERVPLREGMRYSPDDERLLARVNAGGNIGQADPRCPGTDGWTMLVGLCVGKTENLLLPLSNSVIE